MTSVYNVHLYREMRLSFPDIKADSPQLAAQLASQLTTEDATSIEDCDGEDFGALVDLQGAIDFSKSVMIDFEPERIRKAAPKLLEAIDYLLEQTVDMDPKYGIGLSEGEQDARAKALAAIAEATAA